MVIIYDQEEYTIHRGSQRANGSESLALLGMWNGPVRYSLIHKLWGRHCRDSSAVIRKQVSDIDVSRTLQTPGFIKSQSGWLRGFAPRPYTMG